MFVLYLIFYPFPTGVRRAAQLAPLRPRPDLRLSRSGSCPSPTASQNGFRTSPFTQYPRPSWRLRCRSALAIMAPPFVPGLPNTLRLCYIPLQAMPLRQLLRRMASGHRLPLSTRGYSSGCAVAPLSLPYPRNFYLFSSRAQSESGDTAPPPPPGPALHSVPGSAFRLRVRPPAAAALSLRSRCRLPEPRPVLSASLPHTVG